MNPLKSQSSLDFVPLVNSTENAELKTSIWNELRELAQKSIIHSEEIFKIENLILENDQELGDFFAAQNLFKLVGEPITPNLGSKLIKPFQKIYFAFPYYNTGKESRYRVSLGADCPRMTALMQAMIHSDAHKLFKNFLQIQGVDPNNTTQPYLYTAVIKDAEKIVEVLLEDPRVDPEKIIRKNSFLYIMDEQTFGDPSLLMIACEFNKTKSLRALLKKSTLDPNRYWGIDDPENALMYCARKNNLRCAQVLLEDIRVNPYLDAGSFPSPLHLAAEAGNTAMIKLLIANDRFSTLQQSAAFIKVLPSVIDRLNRKGDMELASLIHEYYLSGVPLK